MSEGNGNQHGFFNQTLSNVTPVPPVPTPGPTQVSRTVLLAHSDHFPGMQLDNATVRQLYPKVPPSVTKPLVHMLHFSRYWLPQRDFVMVQNPAVTWPQLSTNHYCRHCFKLQQAGQVCSIPCVNPCAVCGELHVFDGPGPCAYNTVSSWSRSGCIADDGYAPAGTQIMPTREQFLVLQFNGYIDANQAYSVAEAPRFDYSSNPGYQSGTQMASWTFRGPFHVRGSQPFLGRLQRHQSSRKGQAVASSSRRGGSSSTQPAHHNPVLMQSQQFVSSLPSPSPAQWKSDQNRLVDEMLDRLAKGDQPYREAMDPEGEDLPGEDIDTSKNDADPLPEMDKDALPWVYF